MEARAISLFNAEQELELILKYIDDGVCGGEVTDRVGGRNGRSLPSPHEFERDLAGGRHSLLLSFEVDGEVIVQALTGTLHKAEGVGIFFTLGGLCDSLQKAVIP